MVVKLLGAMDVFSAVVVILVHYHLIGWRIGFLFVAYLLIKGWLFREDLNSVMDILCGLYLLVTLFGFTTVIGWIVAIYLFQKGVFSLA